MALKTESVIGFNANQTRLRHRTNTEPGSSGSPLFDQNRRIIGTLHGGFAACSNNQSDWYGRFSVTSGGVHGS